MSKTNMVETIKNLPELLKNTLVDSKIKNVEIKRLTAPGENYGSLMLKLDLTLKSNSEHEEKLQLVAKKIPVDELFKTSFNIQVTFKNEVAMYETVVPILQNFQRENGVQEVINCFPKYYGSRINLNNSDVVDENAILILENLVASGYKNIDRTVGFNLDSIKLILKDLAELHAVSIALKLKKPNSFEPLKKHCHDFEFSAELHQMFWETTREIIKENEHCAKLLDKINLITEVDRPKVKEPFATLVHYDLWCNNSMQKFSHDVAVQNKFLDFQFLAYGSPASDLFFLLWTSVQLEVLENYFEDLLVHYHNHFIKTLKTLGCDTKPFCYEHFLYEIKEQCVFEVGHTLHFIFFVVNGKKDRTEDIKFPDDIDKIKNEVTLRAKQQVWLMLQDCEKRGWLYESKN